MPTLLETNVRNRRYAVPALKNDPELATRYSRLRSFARRVRASEYHLTHACNIRCKGCWFFEYGFEGHGVENKDLAALDKHIEKELARGVNAALLIGGEPTLFLDRIERYAAKMDFVSISSNGLRALPMDGFENVTIFVSLFGGGSLDDELRAIKPGGQRFSGLFDTSLRHYTGDKRVTYVYAMSDDGVEHIEETVRKIEANGNFVTFNYYSKHGQEVLLESGSCPLLDEALRVARLYPRTVLSSEYFIRTLITGRSHWGGVFGYDTCPSISVDHPENQQRIQNGHRSLPLFNTFSADLETVNFCCTSGHCDDCRDSQAIYSWLMMSGGRFLNSEDSARDWVDMAEGYWKQFIWAPFRE